MTIRAALDEATATLRAAGVETPRVDAEWLLADLLPGGRRDVVLGLDRALDAALAARYRGVVHRRAAREPLQLIRGWQDFLDIRVGLAGGVLHGHAALVMVPPIALSTTTGLSNQLIDGLPP